MAFAALLGIAYGIAALRHGLGDAATGFLGAMDGRAALAPRSDNIWFFFLLTAAVPFALTLLEHWLRRAREERRALRDAQRDWDLSEARKRELRDTREQLIQDAQTEADKAKTARDIARDKRRELERSAQARLGRARDQIEAERRQNAEFVNELLAALRLDEFMFVRHAVGRGKVGLLEPTRGVAMGELLPISMVDGVPRAQGGQPAQAGAA